MTLPTLTGLYYPHSHVYDEKVLKTALLLWDKLERIVPAPGYVPYNVDRPSADVLEALDLVGAERVVTQEEKLLAHEEILRLVERPVEDWLFFDVTNPDTTYPIYDPKLLPESWIALREAKLVKRVGKLRDGEFDDWVAHKSLGLTLMGILAEVCAGTQRRTVTDRRDAYAAYTRATTFINGGTYQTIAAKTASDESDHTIRLTTIAAKAVDANLLTLRDLIEFRKREEREKSSDLRILRQNFVGKIDEEIEALGKCRTKNDRDEVMRKFEIEVEQDLKLLNQELAAQGRRVILTESVLLGIASFIALPVSLLGGTPGIWAAMQPHIGVGLIPKAVDTLFGYREKRFETMNKHAMAWLQTAMQ